MHAFRPTTSFGNILCASLLLLMATLAQAHGPQADDDHAVAGSHVPQLPDGVGHGAAAERSGQTGHGGGVSEPGAVIDIVGPYHRPHHFR